MESAEAIDEFSKLKQELSGCYLAAEKLMALRQPDLLHLEQLVSKIENLYNRLMEAVNNPEVPSFSDVKESIFRNKEEFDRYYKSFQQRRSAFEPQLPYEGIQSTTACEVRSSASTKSNGSSRSSRSSAKLRDATIEFRVAQIKAKQAAEKAEEEVILLQQQQTIDRLKAEEEANRLRQQQQIELRNAEREMEIAAAKIEILERQDNLSSTHSNVGNRVNCIVNEQSQLPNTLSRVLAHNNVISNTHSTTPTSINATSSKVNVTPVCEVRNNISIPQQSVADNTRVNAAAISSVSHNFNNNVNVPCVPDLYGVGLHSYNTVDSAYDRFRMQCNVTHSITPQVPACYRSANDYSQTRPFFSGVELPQPLSSAVEQSLPFRANVTQQAMPTTGGGPCGSFWPHESRAYPTRPTVQPPPGFTPFSYLSYDELFLPRPEFKKFNGNPLDFRLFITNFETHVEPRVHNKKMLFCMLLQHCEDNVKSMIEYFGEKDDDQAYQLAKEKLKHEFGRPCIIADICEQQLRDASQVKSNDTTSLKSFSELLEKTFTTLQNLNELSSVNSLDAISKLVSKLPFDMRKRWVRESVTIEKGGRVAKFGDFVKFVTRESDEQGSLYGRRVFAAKPEHKPTGYVKGLSEQTKNKHKSSSSFMINSNFNARARAQCWYCDDCDHRLHDCPKFKEIPVKDKSSFVKSKRLCFKCLSSQHKTNVCKRTNTCSVPGCKGTYHHTLLHNPRPVKADAQVQVGRDTFEDAQLTKEVEAGCSGNNSVAACSHDSNNSDGVYLCVVPVRVHCEGKTVLTYAFLDQGSTHSFCDTKLVQALGATGREENLTLQTLCNPAAKCRGVTLTLSVSSLNDSQSICLPKVFSIENIPVNPNLTPAKGVLSALPHLTGITFPKIPGASVTLLIGADVPEVFCFVDVRKGGRGLPIAVKTPCCVKLVRPSFWLSAVFLTDLLLP